MFLRVYKSRGYVNWMECSVAVTRTAGKGEWLARRLQEWCHDFVQDETKLPTHTYGKFNSSILEDEDLAQEIHLHLQSKGKYVRALEIVHFLKTLEMKQRLNLKKLISERTAQRWMHGMGYWWQCEHKGQYKDGHERQDVVEYHQMIFLPAWLKLESWTRTWDGDSVETSLPGGSQHTWTVVIWRHDESIFYANDRRKLRWVYTGESAQPYAKGEGASLMFADFVSPDYGWLHSKDGKQEARVTWKPGKNRDGYFTTQDVLEQATRAMYILNEHYPDEEHVFVYDNATTHLARRSDALSARKMPLYPPKEKNFLCEVKHGDGSISHIQMQNGTFPDGTPQSFYDEKGWFKGMKKIIEERVDKGTKIPDPRQQRILAQCTKFKCPPGQKDCCCRHILYSQPDFVHQKSILEEHCKAQGFKVMFFLKFHCELNFIEQCWGYAKRVYREFPASSTEADLVANGTAALNAVPISLMRKFSIRSQRFMDAYRRGLNGSQAAWASKKYRGHRVLPESILKELEAAKVT
ncbi:hypothetical protein NEOLEDRAFT_1155206 [Neolentinus lepideus HHB14362 ss-1]|uniref:Uncharacterized protein n=1 Tax=Neolentinus lepideus HHB14362 ss-1 TaxID=1314782 RepID=A0A165TU70_9AGAM|nr:hypothetical protein NEOLEDRAFT_1155206 [Neolentinus lepideus HHB14362 ss-1]